MPLISIIVPVYKVQLLLERCVDSILGQTFPDFELILVDDGSPDDSGRICDEYARKDSRVLVIHQHNGGLSAARNTGIAWVFANSDSQWLMFVDSDDWIREDCLQKLYDAAVEHNCSLSACGFYRTAGEAFPEEAGNETVCLSADDFYCGQMADMIPVSAWGKLYHRSLFRELRYPVGKLHEDEFTTYLAVYASERVAATTSRMYAYYQNLGGITLSKWNPRRLHALEAMKEQMEYAKNKGNDRFLRKASDSYVWAVALQAEQLGKDPETKTKYSSDLMFLRKELKRILKEGLNGCSYPFNRENLLLYEMAYPATWVWNLFHGSYAMVKKLLRR